MLLSRLLADFTRGESDALRKAMGKKLRDKLDHMKAEIHFRRTKERPRPESARENLGRLGKVCILCLQQVTCHLLFVGGLSDGFPQGQLSGRIHGGGHESKLANITDITKLMDECKAMGINTLGPDVNESNLKFTVNKEGNIRFGLGAVKGVGEGAVQSIVEEREKNGPFKYI